jgi:cell division protein FtsB
VVTRVSKYLALAFVTLAIVNGVFGQRGVVEILRLTDRNTALGERVSALEAENAALEEQARRLKHDPSAVEDLARRDLGLLKEGELVIILRDVAAPTPTTPDEFRQDRKKR